MQGDIRNKILQDNKIFTTIKHFTGYSKPVNGINIAPTSISERELRDVHIYPYKRIIDSLDQLAIMPSYHAINQIPCHGSSFLLRDILRNELGFNGYVYSDWGAIEMLHNAHYVSESYKDAAILAVKSGVDLDAPAPDAFQNLESAVESGEVEEKWIDEAVSNILRVKFRTGLFDGRRKKFDETHLKKVVHSQKHVNLAQQVAEEGCVLLVNKDQTLPLNLLNLKNIAVIGPNASQIQLGDYAYSHEPRFGTTVLQGIIDYVGNKAQIHYTVGCGLTDLSTSGFGKAVEISKKSDIVIIVCGGSSRQFGEAGWIDKDHKADVSITNGEGFDRAILSLPGAQEELIKEIHKIGKPMVLVLLNGRPYTIPWMKEHMDAILEAWYPGEQGGNAIANILFGKVNPSGKITSDWPQTTGHIYTQYNYLPISRGFYHNPGSFEKTGRDYVEHTPDPLFPFGFGLSYSTFQYSDLFLQDSVLNSNDNLEVYVTIKNTGNMEGKEIVQLYVHDEYASVTVPVKQLKGFEKVNLKAGESKRLHFSLPVSELALWNQQMEHLVEPGMFEVMIGKSSSDILLKSRFEVK
jgi:beta-glucosidase